MEILCEALVVEIVYGVSLADRCANVVNLCEGMWPRKVIKHEIRGKGYIVWAVDPLELLAAIGEKSTKD